MVVLVKGGGKERRVQGRPCSKLPAKHLEGKGTTGYVAAAAHSFVLGAEEGYPWVKDLGLTRERGNRQPQQQTTIVRQNTHTMLVCILVGIQTCNPWEA